MKSNKIPGESESFHKVKLVIKRIIWVLILKI